VSAEDPGAIGKPIEVLPGERHADADREALPQRARADVYPREHGRGMPLEAAAVLAVGHELLVGDDVRRPVDRGEPRRRVSLGEDEPIVGRRLRVVEVVAEVLVDEDCHEVGRRHRRGRMTGLRGCAAADRVHAQLLAELAPALDWSHGVHSMARVSRSRGTVTWGYGNEQTSSALGTRPGGVDRLALA